MPQQAQLFSNLPSKSTSLTSCSETEPLLSLTKTPLSLCASAETVTFRIRGRWLPIFPAMNCQGEVDGA